MKSRMAIAFMLVCIGFLICASVVGAVSFSETVKEKLVCSSGSTCTVVRTGKFKVSGEAFEGQDLDPSQFNKSSVVAFQAGHLSFNGTLGDDPNYADGDTSARFLVTHIDPGTGKTVTDVKISLKPGSSGVKITASGKISADQSSVLAEDYIGTTGSISTNISGFVQMGTNTEHFTGTIIGTASIKTVIKNDETNNLSTVKLKSAVAP
jgi:hypothetical protein